MKKPPIPGANTTPCRQAVESGAPKDDVDVNFTGVSDKEETQSGFEFTPPGPSTQRDPEELYEDAEQFLLFLGHDYRESWFRTITPKKGANLERDGGDIQFFDYDRLLAENQAGANVYLITGLANSASGISKRTGEPTGCVVDSDITHCTSFFVEWDDRPMEWQVNAWQELGLPEPSLMVETGGKSVHAYWRLRDSIAPEVWKPIQKRLITHCGSDPKCSNPSRLMRMPGFAYVDKKTGQVTPNKAQLIHVSLAQYTLDQIEECLPELQPELAPPVKKSLVKNPPLDWKPRSLQEIAAACRFIPERISGQPESSLHHYEQQRRALCGCWAALADAGVDDPDQTALDLLGDRWSSRAEAEQVLNSSSTRAAGSFWAIAKAGGYDLTQKSSDHHPSASTPIADVTARLRDAIDLGVGGSELTQLIAELAAQSDQHFSVVEKIARSISEEYSNQLSVEAASQGIAAEADRIEDGSLLTAEFLLGPEVGGALDVITKYLPAEGPSAVLPFLTGIAGLVKLGTQVEGSAPASYRVPVNLYSALVAVSGGKKSPVGRLLVEGPLRGLELELHRANRLAVEQWKEQCRGGKSDDKPEFPQPRRIRINEATGEALTQQLVNQEEAGLGLLVYRDELAGLFGSLNQYRGGKGADDEQLLETFDGGGLTSLRVGGARHYTRSQLSIYGSIQPAVLRELLANGDANGLWAWFLFVPLPRRAVPLPMHTSPAEEIEVEHAKQRLAAIAERVYKRPSILFQLASEAARYFRDYEHSRQEAALRADIPAQSALFGKSAGKALRVAGLMHLVRLAAGTDKGGLISKDCLEKACLLVDHLDAWALNLHADIATGGGDAWIAKVQDVALKVGTEIGFRDVSSRLSKKQKKVFDPSRFGQVCHALAAAGYGVLSKGDRGAPRYRATKPLPG